jgi:GT2 family glycosyltransferase
MECIERGMDRVGGLVIREIRDDDTPWACYDKLFFLDQERYVAQGWAATANLVARREVFQRVGVFQTVESGGDYEWGRRAQAAQSSICYSERAAVAHRARHDFGQLAAKIRRLAAGQGREARAERRGRLSAQLLRRAVHARGLARLGVECARGRLAPSSALTLLFAWPILQLLALRSFSLGWAGAPAGNVSSGCHQEIVPSWKVT